MRVAQRNGALRSDLKLLVTFLVGEDPLMISPESSASSWILMSGVRGKPVLSVRQVETVSVFGRSRAFPVAHRLLPKCLLRRLSGPRHIQLEWRICRIIFSGAASIDTSRTALDKSTRRK